ncbi:hypothetical protein WI72_33485 [Burkholderia ubonensis]|nr:hypothetical protein WI72_33485 [Burkholderia ubonensis]
MAAGFQIDDQVSSVFGGEIGYCMNTPSVEDPAVSRTHMEIGTILGFEFVTCFPDVKAYVFIRIDRDMNPHFVIPIRMEIAMRVDDVARFHPGDAYSLRLDTK